MTTISPEKTSASAHFQALKPRGAMQRGAGHQHFEAHVAKLYAIGIPSGAGVVLRTFIVELADRAYALREPIPVSVRSNNGEFIASVDAADVEAHGDSVEDAIVALESIALGYLESLAGARERLAPALSRRLWVLRRYIVAR